MNFLETVTRRDEYLISLNATEGRQFGKKVYAAQVKVSAVLKIFQINGDVQRELDSDRIGGIVKYILSGIENEGKSFYFPPFIFSARRNGKYNEEEMTYSLKSNHKMIVLDGQHRLRALEKAVKYLKTYNQRIYDELMDYPLSLQIYFDLSLEQERQLFSDINSKAIRVGANLIKMYTAEDETAKLLHEIIKNHSVIKIEEFEVRRNQTRTKFMIALTLYKIIAMFDSGKYISNQEIYELKNRDIFFIKEKVDKLLTYIYNYAPYNASNRSVSIYLNQNILLSIVRIAREIPESDWEDILFRKIIDKYDWSQNNKELSISGVPYNQEVMRYRLTPPHSVYESMYNILKFRYQEEKK